MKTTELSSTDPTSCRRPRRRRRADGAATTSGCSSAHRTDTRTRCSASFRRFLDPGDLIVVNDSATLPASLCRRRATSDGSSSTCRRGSGRSSGSPSRAGRPIVRAPCRFTPGDRIMACDQPVRLVSAYPGAERLWFVEGDLAQAMNRCGQPIRYGYVDREQPLTAYQTLFAKAPGSAEMPSAARPFTKAVVDAPARARCARSRSIRLHTGVSSLEIETEDVEQHTLPPEPFRVTAGDGRRRELRARGRAAASSRSGRRSFARSSRHGLRTTNVSSHATGSRGCSSTRAEACSPSMVCSRGSTIRARATSRCCTRSRDGISSGTATSRRSASATSGMSSATAISSSRAELTD